MARLRIISGEFGGRFISADVGRATHPMGDRVRSAMFNMIDVTGTGVLDAYAGTGAVGLEALSRGAARVDFVENNRLAQKVIAENIAALKVQDKARLYKMSLKIFLDSRLRGNDKERTQDDGIRTRDDGGEIRDDGGESQNDNDKTQKYDIVFADPPYHLFPKEFSTVFRLKNVVKSNGLMILSYPGRLCVSTVNGVVVVDKRKFGEATLIVFRLEE
jgi:16S rRNA (guanine966-N2)-methyltransferase